MKGLGYYAQRINADIRKDRSNTRFIAAASVWLNQARWETEGPPDNRPSPPKRTVAI